MLVSLFTARVVLNSLGVEDFGIYNVVGGVVVMISFLNIAMASSTQRFLNFEMGKNNIEELKRVFSMSVNIHFILGIVIFIFLETVGIWFLENKLVIPESRMVAAKTVFHFSSLSMLVTIINVPYYADIIANEKMNIFAYIGIAEVILKLVVAYIIFVVNSDKLIVYGILLFAVTALVQMFYFFYSRKNFIESRYSFFWDKKMFKTIISFTGWNMFGSFATVMKNQGVSIILNIFFGPALNAAKAVSAQVENALTSFVTNFQTAMKPQIVKSYASNETSFLLNLIFSGAKYSYFLFFAISLPILLETEYILKLWLRIVPEFSVVFVRLTIITALVDTLSVTLMNSMQATGKIKVYQIVIGALLLSILPISYFFFKFGYPPESTFIVGLVIFSIILFARIFLVKKYISFSFFEFLKEVIWKAGIVSIVSAILPILVIYYFEPTFYRLVLTVVVSLAASLATIYFIGMNKDEKSKIRQVITKACTSIIKK